MKMNTNLRLVENNSNSTKNFTIQASGKMFHMVISGLYSNKPQSITREIWSNAFDAHSMVGKEDVPFEVTFPSVMTPTFSCRDFGPGIAHEDMEGFYTVLGHSTKENTNTAVGKWGVGRMSPMSYTDTFTVVSRHKGMIAYYTIQLGPDGSPCLHVLAEPAPTEEPSGLEVSFPVKGSDILDFQKAAKIVALGFDVKPVVKNSKEFTFDGMEKLHEGKNFYIYKSKTVSGVFAKMGCVLYPIPPQYLSRGKMDNIVFKFDIGELEVTASREALSFGPSDPTANSIRSKDATVQAELETVLQAAVDKEPKMFKATRLGRQLQSFLPYKASPLTYKGNPLERFWNLGKYSNILISTGTKGYSQKKAGWGLDNTVETHKDYTIFVEDTGNKKANVRAASRIGAVVATYENYIWVRANLSNPDHKADLESMLSDIDYPVLYVKDLPDAGPVGGSRSRATIKVTQVNAGQVSKQYDMDDTEFQKGGYMYLMSNNDYPEVLSKFPGLLQLALGTKRVTLVPKTIWNKFQGQPQWKDAYGPVVAYVNTHEKELVRFASTEYNIFPFTKLTALSPRPGMLGDFLEKVCRKTVDYEGELPRSVVQRLLGHFGKSVGNNEQVVAEYRAILDKYPLLDLLGHTGTSGRVNKTHFENYITLIDNADKE